MRNIRGSVFMIMQMFLSKIILLFVRIIFEIYPMQNNII